MASTRKLIEESLLFSRPGYFYLQIALKSTSSDVSRVRI